MLDENWQSPFLLTLCNGVVEEWWYDHFCHYQAISQADRMTANFHFLIIPVWFFFSPNTNEILETWLDRNTFL